MKKMKAHKNDSPVFLLGRFLAYNLHQNAGTPLRAEAPKGRLLEDYRFYIIISKRLR